MKWVARFLLTSILSLGIAALLSALPRLDRSDQLKKSDMSAFGHTKWTYLGAQNLVDQLAGLKLETEIGRVDWSHDVLSIDLKSRRIGTDSSFVYRDLYEIIRLALVNTTNVKQVRVRVFEAELPDARGQLLLALDARRNEVGAGPLPDSHATFQSLVRYLESHFRITYTQKWNEKTAPSY